MDGVIKSSYSLCEIFAASHISMRSNCCLRKAAHLRTFSLCSDRPEGVSVYAHTQSTGDGVRNMGENVRPCLSNKIWLEPEAFGYPMMERNHLRRLYVGFSGRSRITGRPVYTESRSSSSRFRSPQNHSGRYV